MLKKQFYFLAFIALISCNADDDITTSDNEALTLSDFSIISFDDEAYYEYEFNEITQDATEINLTAQEGISRQTFFVNRLESVFGFYNEGNALIKDFISEDLFFVDDFGGNPGELRLTSRNDNETVGIVYTFNGTDQLFLRVIDVVTSFQFELPLGDLSTESRLFVNGDMLYVLSNEANGATIIQIDKSSQTISNQLSLPTQQSSLVIIDDAFYAIDFSGNYTVYQATDFSVAATGSNSFIPANNTLFKERDGLIYSLFLYQQPSAFLFGPATYNLNDGTSNLVDIETTFNIYATENDDVASVTPVHFDYDTLNDVWIVAFVAQAENGNERFGYFVIDNAGSILQETDLPRLPWTVIVHN